jgi:ligand-binding sensor domain-containing protein
MNRILLITFSLLWFLNSTGQTPVGSWSDHLTYNTAKNVAVGTEEVYASTGSSIIVYNKEYAELKKMSRISGLTETGISTIAWSENNRTLIIAYTSTNVDLLIDNIVYNIPDINRKYIPGKKEINRIRTNGKFAYLACSFGIVIVDIIKKEIYDTWKPAGGSSEIEVWDIAFGNSKIYAATGKGVFSADLSNPGLSYFGNWTQVDISQNPNGNYTSLIFSGNKLYANLSSPSSDGDYIYEINDVSSLFSFIPGVFNKSFDPVTSGFTITSSSSVRYYNNNGSLQETISAYGWGTTNISHAVADNTDIWIADLNSGLVKGENMSVFKALTLPGPVSNNAYYITSQSGKTIICGGAADVSWNNIWRPLEVSIYDNNYWTSLLPVTIKDAVRALVDPNNSNHIFVSSWGGGLLEYENNNLVKQYVESNSPLETVVPGKPYVRICGMAMDKDKNLWITQSHVSGSIKILKPDGSWIVNPLTIDAPMVGDILITRKGYKWIVLPRGNGLCVLDDNNTIDIFSDDRYKKMLVEDIENKVISYVYSIAEDLDGNIWVGTDQGPLIYYDPEKIFDDNLKAYRIKIPRNDRSGFADYMLGTEIITSIAVDGANRKWLGTFSSGAYLLSPDGTTRVKNYNEQNSPILSNSVVSLAVDNKSGDVWFGTSKGVISVRGDATEGEEKFTNVYTFPNPVREDFTGNVTITGLMRDTQVTITNISGNLVFKTISDGGQATWDLKTYNGQHVSTGVYLVFCASSDGLQTFVTKMLVIK